MSTFACGTCRDVGWVLETAGRDPLKLDLIECPVPDCTASGQQVAALNVPPPFLLGWPEMQGRLDRDAHALRQAVESYMHGRASLDEVVLPEIAGAHWIRRIDHADPFQVGAATVVSHLLSQRRPADASRFAACVQRVLDR